MVSPYIELIGQIDAIAAGTALTNPTDQYVQLKEYIMGFVFEILAMFICYLMAKAVLLIARVVIYHNKENNERPLLPCLAWGIVEGALVCDSSRRENYAVCAGYSRAFQHLLHMAGIPCGYISGYAYVDTEEKPDDSNHAWNCVKVGGKWYEVDTTWDDFDHLGDDEGTNAFFDSLENNQNAYFNTLHHYYNRSTMEMKDLPVTDETVFSILYHCHHSCIP